MIIRQSIPLDRLDVEVNNLTALLNPKQQIFVQVI